MILNNGLFRALTNAETLVIGFLDGSLLIDITQTQVKLIIVGLTATDTHAIIMHKSRPGNLVHPVGIRVTVDQSQVDGGTTQGVQLLLIIVPFRTGHQIEVVQHLIHAPIRVERNGGLANLTFLRGNQDNAVRSTGTIDSGSGSVFQHFDRLNIGCTQIVDIRHGHSIHDIQRLSVVDRTDTTDTDRSRLTRRTGTGGNRHAGSQTLQSGRDISHGLTGDILLAHGRDRSRNITLLHCSVANDHDLIQSLRILPQGDLQDRLIANSNLLVHITDIGYPQDSVF